VKRNIIWAVVLLIPMALYITGITQGYPKPAYSPSTVQKAWLNPETVYHPDEFAYVGISYRMLLKRDWNPHYYHNPPLNIYSNMALFALSGAHKMPHNSEYNDREIAPFQLYVMARYLSALYSLLTVVLTFAAGRTAFNRRAGWIAAGLVALSPLITQHAHYATPNAETTMLSTAALLLAFIILKDRVSARLPVYVIAGLLVGLTMAARYNAAVVGLVTGLAMLTAWWSHRQWLPLALGLAAMPLGFALATPGIILVNSEVVDQIRDILHYYRVKGGGTGFTTDRGLSGFFYHWRYLVLIVVGPVAAVAALFGLGLMLRHKHSNHAWIGLVLALYLLAYTVAVLPGKRIQANLLFPLIVPLALLAAYGVTWVQTRRRWLGSALVLGLWIWPAILSMLFAYRITIPDSRMHAQEWIYEHVPHGSQVYLLGPYNVPLDPLDYQITQTFKGEATPDDVRQSKAQIIVYSDAAPFVTQRAPSLTDDPAAVAAEKEIAQVLQSGWIELARFKRMSWPGENLPPDDVSYWHQIEIVIYCHPKRCPA
jgi:MFS family permease